MGWGGLVGQLTLTLDPNPTPELTLTLSHSSSMINGLDINRAVVIDPPNGVRYSAQSVMIVVVVWVVGKFGNPGDADCHFDKGFEGSFLPLSGSYTRVLLSRRGPGDLL